MKNYTKLKKIFQDDPETLASLEHQEKMELLGELASKEVETVKIEGLEMIKGDKGEPGEKGDQGERGLTGLQGEIGPQGEPGNKGDRGFTGNDGKDGKDGKDGSPDTPKQIAEKLNTLKEVLEIEVLKGYESSDDIIKKIKKQGLEMRDVKGLPLNLMELLHGGGITNIYNGSTLVTNSGTSLNFTGSGVSSVTNINGAVTVDITGGGGSPAGSIYEVQTNDGAGNFAADAKFSYNPTTDILTVGDKIAAHSSLDLTITTSAGTFLMKFGEAGGQQTTWYGNLKFNSGTASTILSLDGSKNITSLSTATYPSLTELAYVKGATSNIQTQINAGKMRIGNSVEAANNNNVLFTDGTGKLAQNNGYFQYTDQQLLVTADNGNTPLRVFQNSGQYLTEWYSGTTFTTSKYVMVDEDLTAGYAADVGSWGLGYKWFEIKYDEPDDAWGKVLYKSLDTYIRSPNYPVEGTMDMSFDTGNGGFLAGDILGIGDNLILQIGSSQVVFGNYSNTNFFLDDAVGNISYSFGGSPYIDFNADGMSLGVAGLGIKIKEGTNATMGIATLVAGTVTVNTTKVTANSRIFLTRQTTAGTLGTSVNVTARTAGTSFTITSQGSVLDTSTVAWQIVEPA